MQEGNERGVKIMYNSGRTIYTLHKGKMMRIAEPKNPKSANFLIVCAYGDWSGFRTLEGCEKQFPELEPSGQPDDFYRVVER